MGSCNHASSSKPTASIPDSVVAPLTIWAGAVLRSKEEPVSSAQIYPIWGAQQDSNRAAYQTSSKLQSGTTQLVSE